MKIFGADQLALTDDRGALERVQELAHVAAPLAREDGLLRAEDLHPPGRRAPRPGMDAADLIGHDQTLDELERLAIERALLTVDGNRRKAAEKLGIGLRTLYEKLKRYEIG